MLLQILFNYLHVNSFGKFNLILYLNLNLLEQLPVSNIQIYVQIYYFGNNLSFYACLFYIDLNNVKSYI